MVNVTKRKCTTEGCGKEPSFGVADTKTVEYCAQHAPYGMVNVKKRKCIIEGCSKQPSFGVAGTRKYCSQHAPDGMVNVKSRKCVSEGCSKQPSFGVAGTKTAEYCTQHAPDGMVTVRFRKCRTKASGIISAFEVAGMTPAEYCVQHNRPRCGIEECRGRGIDRNHYGEETIGDASPSRSKHKTVKYTPAQANPLSGGSRGSRKRVQYLHDKSTALKRAVALESAAGKATMPEIDGQKSLVKRDSSVKTEVHVSF